ncbi:MAG: arylformamidase [Acidobacteriota bacterium]|jgi:arylformamidase|nr:arylformamidase [Acidobacteriota bacterium]MDT5261515.1 arylformamidase [Acidobacteriota bacterium]
MTIYDISVPVTPGETPTYPGDPDIEVSAWTSISRGDPANVSMLKFGAHTGTHVDAPAHFIEGAPGLTSLPLEAFLGEARVIEIPADALAVEESHVREAALRGASRVLFKTRNSGFWKNPRGHFREDFTYITHGAARSLVGAGVRLVGFDYLSVEKFGSLDFETHLTLLSGGVIILEGLDLRGIRPGTYELICLPLNIAAGSGDGAPARAVLRTLD